MPLAGQLAWMEPSDRGSGAPPHHAHGQFSVPLIDTPVPAITGPAVNVPNLTLSNVQQFRSIRRRGGCDRLIEMTSIHILPGSKARTRQRIVQ